MPIVRGGGSVRVPIWLAAAATELIYVPSRMGGISDSLEH